jgi:prepilin-type N-terminal cleavage/methylation domain-containing protein
MRRGYTLVEMLLVVIIAPFIFLFLDGLFKTFIGEIPWSLRIVDEHTVLLNMTEQMQKDIDKAKDLPESYAGRTSNDGQILIEQPEGVLCYRIEDGRVIRQKLTEGGQSDAEQPTVWLLPHSNIRWKIWERNGRGYAVETHTYIEHIWRGQWKKKMANTYLYFAGALGGKELQ